MSSPLRNVYVLIRTENIPSSPLRPVSQGVLALYYNVSTKMYYPTIVIGEKRYSSEKDITPGTRPMSLEDIKDLLKFHPWEFTLNFKGHDARDVLLNKTEEPSRFVWGENARPFPLSDLTDVIEKHAYAPGTESNPFLCLVFTAKHVIPQIPRTGGGRRPRSRSSQKPRRVQKKRRGVSRSRSRSRRSASKQRRQRARGTR